MAEIAYRPMAPRQRTAPPPWCFMPFMPPAWGAQSNGGPYVPSYWHPAFFLQTRHRANSPFGDPASTDLVLHGDPLDDFSTPEPQPKLILPPPKPRDTPSEYPCPPTDDPNNPPVPIHPYLYQVDCPVVWDVRTNFRHSARRTNGEPLSALALKANAINAAGMNHNTMKIICGDEGFPWTVTVNRETGITVADVLMEIATALDAEMTEPEQLIAGRCAQKEPERWMKAVEALSENVGTGAVKTREKDDVMRRVDWLGKRTKFLGLVHSSAKEYEALVRRKVHTHEKPNAWVMVLGERE